VPPDASAKAIDEPVIPPVEPLPEVADPPVDMPKVRELETRGGLKRRDGQRKMRR